jgi:hypothetical protein
MQDAFPWTRQPSFTAHTLTSLRELNQRFLDLAVAHSDHFRLPGGASEQLERLSARERAAAADCPYAVFDLSLHDDAHWRSRLGAAWCVAEVAVDPDVAAFVRLALFYAWHLADTPKLGSRLWLGMTEPTAAAFRAASLERLPALASSEGTHLSVRWPKSAYFWNSLARAAAQGDSRRLRQVQLLGLQISAAPLLA